MGDIFAEIKLSNPRNQLLKPVVTQALADTGALMLCIPDYIAIQLELEMVSKSEVTVADGRSMSVPYAGPIKVEFRDRFCYVGALVLLGAVPIEDMDLVLSPALREVTAEPRSPNTPHAKAKYMKPD